MQYPYSSGYYPPAKGVGQAGYWRLSLKNDTGNLRSRIARNIRGSQGSMVIPQTRKALSQKKEDPIKKVIEEAKELETELYVKLGELMKIKTEQLKQFSLIKVQLNNGLEIPSEMLNKLVSLEEKGNSIKEELEKMISSFESFINKHNIANTGRYGKEGFKLTIRQLKNNIESYDSFKKELAEELEEQFTRYTQKQELLVTKNRNNTAKKINETNGTKKRNEPRGLVAKFVRNILEGSLVSKGKKTRNNKNKSRKANGFSAGISVPTETIRSRSQELMNQLTKAEQEKENLKEQMEDLRGQAMAARSGSAEKTQLQAKVANLQDEVGSYQQTIRNLKQQLRTLEAEITTLQRNNTTRRNNRSTFVVNTLNRNSRRNSSLLPTTRPNAAIAPTTRPNAAIAPTTRPNAAKVPIKKPTTIESGLFNPYTGKYS